MTRKVVQNTRPSSRFSGVGSGHETRVVQSKLRSGDQEYWRIELGLETSKCETIVLTFLPSLAVACGSSEGRREEARKSEESEEQMKWGRMGGGGGGG